MRRYEPASRLTILMSNIAVVTRFQKPWALTSDLDSAGISTCPGCPTNLSAPFNFLPLPPWASTAVSVLSSDSPHYCRAPAPVLSPYNVLLLILGSYVIALGTRAWDPRAPQSFVASSCRARKRPPIGHDRAYSIKNFLPQPLQVVGMSCGISPYLRRKLSRNSSQDSSLPLKRWGTALSHEPLLVALLRRFLSWPPASSFRLASSPSSTCIFAHLSARLA